MIKINLLPVRATKKKESAKQQVYIFAIALAVYVGLGFLLFSYEMVKIKATNDDIKRSTQELQHLKTVIGEIDNIKKLKDEVTKKLDILNRLRKEKTGPAIRLAKLSDAAPEKVWLTKYAETGAKVSISGVALNEDLIASFMRNLQATDDFIDVELLVSEQKEINGIKLKRFDITCMLNQSKKDEPAQKPKK
jgi:type IV pilus assembly protein PilN